MAQPPQAGDGGVVDVLVVVGSDDDAATAEIADAAPAATTAVLSLVPPQQQQDDNATATDHHHNDHVYHDTQEEVAQQNIWLHLILQSILEEVVLDEDELERAKANVLRGVETNFNEREKETSRSALSELLRNFTNGEQFQGIEWEMAALQRYLPGITVADVNAAAATMLTGSGLVVMATVSEKEGMPAPTDDSLKAVVEAVAVMEIPPMAAEEVAGDLLAELPTPGSVVSKARDEANDLDVWTLSNGITVLVKPTDFKADEIRVEGFTRGGHSLATDDDYIAAATANSIRRASGVGPFTATQLGKWLAGRNASVSLTVSELGNRARATTTPDDLEIALQLLHAHATLPRFDEDGFTLAQANGKDARWCVSRVQLRRDPSDAASNS